MRYCLVLFDTGSSEYSREDSTQHPPSFIHCYLFFISFLQRQSASNIMLYYFFYFIVFHWYWLVFGVPWCSMGFPWFSTWIKLHPTLYPLFFIHSLMHSTPASARICQDFGTAWLSEDSPLVADVRRPVLHWAAMTIHEYTWYMAIFIANICKHVQSQLITYNHRHKMIQNDTNGIKKYQLISKNLKDTQSAVHQNTS